MNHNGAGVRAIQPGEDVHQGALPGPILSQQGMDFTGSEVKINLVICAWDGRRAHAYIEIAS